MNILFIQYGDYRMAFQKFKTKGVETYKGQRYSIDYVENLKRLHNREVSVFCIDADCDYDENLENGVRVMGLYRKKRSPYHVCLAIDKVKPSHIILRTPLNYVLQYAEAHKIQVLPLFADFLDFTGVRSWLRLKQLGNALKSTAIPLIANHNLPACKSLAKMGIPKSKIVPWDWPAQTTPDDYPVKSLGSGTLRLLFVGAITQAKGSFECINAMRHLDSSKHDFQLQLIGQGDLVKAQSLIDRLPKPAQVKLLGPLSNARVIQEMAQASIIIVPSRHEYPEGMPNTVYEGLTTRTPLIVSDHPVFTGRFAPDNEVIFFKSPQDIDLAEKISFLADRPDLYQKLSANTKSVWQKIQMPLKWGELISKWLEGDSGQQELLAKYSLDKLAQ